MLWASTHEHLQLKHHRVGSGNLCGQSGSRTFMCVFIDGEEGEVGHPEEIQLLRIKIQVSWLWQDRRHLGSDVSQSVHLKNRVWSWEQHDFRTVWQLNLQMITTATSNHFNQALVVSRVFVSLVTHQCFPLWLLLTHSQHTQVPVPHVQLLHH